MTDEAILPDLVWRELLQDLLALARNKRRPPTARMQSPAAKPHSMSRPHAWVLVVWGVVLLVGLGAMAVRDNRPGAPGLVPQTWPSASKLTRDCERFTLVLFAHPHCPCTVASLRELERITSRSRDRLRAEIVFCVPDGAPTDWEKTELWEQARSIPDVSVMADRGGVETRHFGARTSGTTLLFDAQGDLRFQGGITGARGHEGDNAGKSAVLACMGVGNAGAASVPVFGCPLCDSEQTDAAAATQPTQRP